MIKKSQMIKILSKISVSMVFLTGVSGMYAQTVNDNALEKLKSQCEQVIKLENDIQKRQGLLDIKKKENEKLRMQWNSQCQAVLADQNSSLEELQYLLENTNPAFDGEDLYNRIKTEIEKRENSGNLDNNKTQKSPFDPGKTVKGQDQKEELPVEPEPSKQPSEQSPFNNPIPQISEKEPEPQPEPEPGVPEPEPEVKEQMPTLEPETPEPSHSEKEEEKVKTPENDKDSQKDVISIGKKKF